MKGRLFLWRKHYDDTGFESRAQTLTTHTYFTRGRSILYWNIHCNAMCALTVIRQGPSTKVIISACLSLRLIQTCGASSIARLPLWCYLESRVGTVLKTHSRCWLKWKRVLSRFSLWRARRRDRVRGMAEWSGGSDGALLVNGTLALRRARGVATLLRVEETAVPRDAPQLETRDTWESLRESCLIHDSRSNCSRMQFQ